MSVLKRVCDFLWGNVRPTWQFWLAQYFVLLVMTTGPALLFFAYLLMPNMQNGPHSPDWIEITLMISIYVFFIFGWIQHVVASFRSAKHATTRAGRFLCRAYAPIFASGTIGAVVFMGAQNYQRFQRKARQSEAKIALAGIFGAEQAFLASKGQYSTDMEAIGYSPEGTKAFYLYAIVRCKNSKKDPPAIIDHPGLKGGEAVHTALSSALQERTSKEDCTGRANGFTAFAAGQLGGSGSSVDVWRMDEAKHLENVQIGI